MSFLQDSPPKWSKPEWQEWIRLLANQIYREDDILLHVDDAGISPGNLRLRGTAETIWRSVHETADNERKVAALISSIRQRSPAISERLDDELLSPEPPVVEAPQPKKPKFRGFEGNERQIVAGDDTLLDIAFLETGLYRASGVCRVTTTFGDSNRFHGTGFRISENEILTNHHVLYDQRADDRPATGADAWFGFELDRFGAEKTVDEVALDVQSIRSNKEHDWAVITTARPIPELYQEIPLAEPTTPVSVDDRVYIIQHPLGTRKKIGMHHNLVRHVDDDVLQYWTDTEAGSSGSPVFNRHWELVGLHHRWELTEGKYGWANQGRRIDKVIATMQD